MTDLEAFTAAYMEACKDRPADWNEIGYWYARKLWDAALKHEREGCAVICEGLKDLNEEKRALTKFRDAEGKSTSDALSRGQHWSAVSLYNAALHKAAEAIRSRSK